MQRPHCRECGECPCGKGRVEACQTAERVWSVGVHLLAFRLLPSSEFGDLQQAPPKGPGLRGRPLECLALSSTIRIARQPGVKQNTTRTSCLPYLCLGSPRPDCKRRHHAVPLSPPSERAAKLPCCRHLPGRPGAGLHWRAHKQLANSNFWNNNSRHRHSLAWQRECSWPSWWRTNGPALDTRGFFSRKQFTKFSDL